MIKFLSIKKLAIIGVLTVAALTTAVISGVSEPAAAADCTNGTKYTDFDGSRSGNTLTVWPKKKLCKDVNVNFTTFKILNKNYNGKPFSKNPTAIPQASIWNKTVTLKKGTTSKVSVAMQTPDACTPYQIDAYIGPVQTKITTSAGLVNTTAIVAKLFDKTKTDCNPPVVKTIEVCRLSDKKYPVTIKESEFDAKKYSKNPEDCKPKEKTIEVCRLSDKTYPVTIKESEFDSSKYSKNPKDCEAEDKDIQVCRLSDKQYPVTIKESEFDSSKYSKDPNDCKTTEEKTIEVCRLSDKKYPVTIKESEFDSSKYSNDSTDCEAEETPKELPHTGPVEAFASLIGAGSLTGATATYFKSRRSIRKL